jgi:hypothetical protein
MDLNSIKPRDFARKMLMITIDSILTERGWVPPTVHLLRNMKMLNDFKNTEHTGIISIVWV